MLPWLTAVAEKVFMAATGIFQGIGQHRHLLERPLVVDGLGHFRHQAVLQLQPGWLHRHGTNWVTEDVTQEAALVRMIGAPAGRHKSPIGSHQ
jgi:hypothetical protein